MNPYRQHKPQISVIIPAYNAAAFIHRALESLFVQTLQPTEILVIDDCSSDDTCTVIKDLAKHYPNIRLLKQTQNSGPSAARNRGIEEATGDWIVFLDADDAFTPNRIELLYTAAKQQNLDLITDNQTNFDSISGKFSTPTLFNASSHIRFLNAKTFVKGSIFIPTWREILNLGHRPHYPLMKWMVRRAFLNEHNLRFNTQYRVSEDFHFAVQALAVGKAGIIPNQGYIYTESVSSHTGQRSTTSKTVASFEQTLASVDSLLVQFTHAKYPQLHNMLQRRKASVLLYKQAEKLKAHIRKKHLFLAFCTFLQNPRLLWILLHKISKSMRFKILKVSKL